MNDFDTNKSLHPIRRGVVKNWEQLEVLWKLMLDDIGITATDSTSVRHSRLALLLFTSNNSAIRY